MIPFIFYVAYEYAAHDMLLTNMLICFPYICALLILHLYNIHLLDSGCCSFLLVYASFHHHTSPFGFFRGVSSIVDASDCARPLLLLLVVAFPADTLSLMGILRGILASGWT